MKIRIIICDDHPLITEGLQSLISLKNNMQVLAVASSAGKLRELLQQHSPDVLLLDISLPDGNGIELCKEIKTEFPNLKIIGLSNHTERSYIVRMLKNGASGYLLKSSPISEIENTIDEVYHGKMYFGNDAGKILTSIIQNEISETPIVTKREKEVLQYISQGLTSAQIAEKMFISTQTVDSHRKNLMSKFEVNKSVNLIQKAKELDFL